MAIAEIKIVPVGTDSASFSSTVAACFRVAEETPGVQARITPTSTILEGDLEQVLGVVRRMHRVPFREGVERVITQVFIDERRDKPQDMQAMVEAIEDRRPSP